MGINIELINSINKFLLRNIRVNFTFLNLVSQKNMVLRLSKRKNLNRYDKFRYSFYKKIQNGFIKIQKKNPKNYMKINSDLNISINKKSIISKVEELI